MVTAEDLSRRIEVGLHGLQGESIDGVSVATAMPFFSDRLGDAEIGAIVDHARTSWRNDAPAVEAAEVAAGQQR